MLLTALLEYFYLTDALKHSIMPIIILIPGSSVCIYGIGSIYCLFLGLQTFERLPATYLLLGLDFIDLYTHAQERVSYILA